MQRAKVPPQSGEDVTGLLREWTAGNDAALPRVMPLVYTELRRLAQSLMAGERSDHTLQATALVHEAFVGLARGRRPALHSRKHFINTVARMMRRALIDHARARATAKRQGGSRVSLDSSGVGSPPPLHGAGDPETFLAEVIAFDRAFEALEAQDPRKARALELRVFGGQDLQGIAELLEVSRATVVSDLSFARVWLSRAMEVGADGGS